MCNASWPYMLGIAWVGSERGMIHRRLWIHFTITARLLRGNDGNINEVNSLWTRAVRAWGKRDRQLEYTLRRGHVSVLRSRVQCQCILPMHTSRQITCSSSYLEREFFNDGQSHIRTLNLDFILSRIISQTRKLVRGSSLRDATSTLWFEHEIYCLKAAKYT